MAPLLGAGDRLNLTITFVVALAVSLAHAHHAAVMLKQQKQIVEINAKLQKLARLEPMTGLLNKTTWGSWRRFNGRGRRWRFNAVWAFVSAPERSVLISSCMDKRSACCTRPRQLEGDSAA